VRGVPTRRRPARVIVSRGAGLSTDRRLILTAREERTIVLCDADPRAEGTLELERAGVVLAREPASGDAGWLRRGLIRLRADHGVNTLMVEGGGKLLASLMAEALVNEVHVHAATTAAGGDGVVAPPMDDESVWRVVSMRRVSDDVQTVYRRR
ncbi:MAG TPA: dihydrofolate reductase family protein, partial [Phycisphaerales bacterium]|nr:dihydrofolate reductase family protein [Phycisphaerales bacterium]